MSIAGQAPETVQNAIQNFRTAGIKPLTRPSLIIRVFMGVVAWVERLNLKYSKVGNPPIYEKAVFPWIREIEREWRLVRGELDRVLTRIVPEPREQLGIRVEKDIYRWKEGEAVVFDDAYEHEAWNYTPQTRVVHSSISASRCVSRSISSIGYCYISLCSPPSSARACTTRRPGRRNSTRKPRRYGIAATRLDLAADHA